VSHSMMAEKLPWFWNEPHKPFSTLIKWAKEGRALQNAKVYFLDNGEIMIGFGNNFYASDALVTDIHIDWFRSRDGGRCWNETDQAPPDVPPVETNLAIRAIKLPDGTLLAAGSYGWDNHEDTPENRKRLSDQGFYFFSPEEGNGKGTISIIHRCWMKRSQDQGKTWEHKDIKLPRFVPHLANYGDPIVTREGAFILPMWGRFDLKDEPRFVSAIILTTKDAGETWDIRMNAKTKWEFDLAEMSITQAHNGHLVALIRTTQQKELWTVISKDDGETWSEPRFSGLRGSTPWIVTTSDGLVVGVYARRAGHPGGGEFTHTGLCACVSRDHGQTWNVDHQVVIHDGGSEWVDGYPCAVTLPDGTVIATYGFYHTGCIAATRFDPRHPDFGTGTVGNKTASDTVTCPCPKNRDTLEASLEYQKERGRKLSGQ
jgi:hypothetical protein